MRIAAPAIAARRLRLRQGAAVVALMAALLSGCASVGPASTANDLPLVATPQFDIAGRLSARRGSDGGAAHFTWRHRPESDVIDVATPMGQTIARMTGDATGVRVERPGKPSLAAANWDVLTRDVLGVPVPVEGLATWVTGAPRTGVPFGLERDRAGRPAVLRQSGWEIVYAYADGAPSAQPLRLVMRYPDPDTIEVRIVVDRWNETSAP